MKPAYKPIFNPETVTSDYFRDMDFFEDLDSTVEPWICYAGLYDLNMFYSKIKSK